MHVLSISYGRALFVAHNSERKRLKRCAQEIESFHMIIFSLKRDGLSICKEGNLTLYPTNSKTKLHMLWDATFLGRRIISQTNGDWVVTSQDPFEAGIVGYIISRLARKPFNVQEHGDFFSTSFWRKSTLLNNVRFLMGIIIMRKADTIRVVSQRIATALVKYGIMQDRIISLPVRTDAISKNAYRMDLHAAYPDASVIILCMGRLVPQKNIPLLIAAFQKLQRIDNKALLLIVGEGREQKKLEHLILNSRLAQNVALLPWSDNAFGLMQGADIFALSSDWEGWGRVLIESMAAGIPAVTTNVGCVGEVFINNRHGFVVGVGDMDAFAEKLIALANDPEIRQRFGRQAVEDVQQIHTTTSSYAKAWEKVWRVTAISAKHAR